MSDQCMLCHHPAEDWPGEWSFPSGYHSDASMRLNVEPEVKQVPLCHFHMMQCLRQSVAYDRWLLDFVDHHNEILDAAESIASGEQSFIYDHIYRASDKVVGVITSNFCASVDIDRFHKWFAFRLVDLAKRKESSGLIHRCNNSTCKNFVENVGDFCGLCFGRIESDQIENDIADKVPELLRIWQSL